MVAHTTAPHLGRSITCYPDPIAPTNMHYDLRETGYVNKYLGQRLLDAFAADDAIRAHLHFPSLAMTFVAELA